MPSTCISLIFLREVYFIQIAPAVTIYPFGFWQRWAKRQIDPSSDTDTVFPIVSISSSDFCIERLYRIGPSLNDRTFLDIKFWFLNPPIVPIYFLQLSVQPGFTVKPW